MKAYRQRQKSLRNAQHKELEKQLYQQILQLVFSQDYFGIEKSIFKAIQPGCEYWIISVKQKTSFGFVEYSKLKRFAPVGSLFPVELSVFEKSFDDCFSDLVSIANSDFVQNFALLPHNYVRLKSVESASNTHTKVLHTVLNDKNSRAINTHTKVWNPVLFQQNKAG